MPNNIYESTTYSGEFMNKMLSSASRIDPAHQHVVAIPGTQNGIIEKYGPMYKAKLAAGEALIAKVVRSDETVVDMLWGQDNGVNRIVIYKPYYMYDSHWMIEKGATYSGFGFRESPTTLAADIRYEGDIVHIDGGQRSEGCSSDDLIIGAQSKELVNAKVMSYIRSANTMQKFIYTEPDGSESVVTITWNYQRNRPLTSLSEAMEAMTIGNIELDVRTSYPQSDVLSYAWSINHALIPTSIPIGNSKKSYTYYFTYCAQESSGRIPPTNFTVPLSQYDSTTYAASVKAAACTITPVFNLTVNGQFIGTQPIGFNNGAFVVSIPAPYRLDYDKDPLKWGV